MTGLPYLPKRNFEITFRSNPVKSYAPDGKPSIYFIEAVVTKYGIELEPRKWRTAYRFLWHEFDRIYKELGTLFNVTLRVEDKLNPVIIINNPNKSMFEMESLLK